MKPTNIIPYLPAGKVFTKQTFRETVRSIDPDCPETTINWMLISLRKQNHIASPGSGKYYLITDQTPLKKVYTFPHSPEYLELEKIIFEKYPLLDFQMWELIQMNDFVNHQITKNVIFIEVESMLVDTVYENLHVKYPYAMLQPDTKSFYKQRAPGTDIIVQKLISESPSPGEYHSCQIEKLLVDLLSKKLSGKLIERSEYQHIYEDIFTKYTIDETCMLRYANRRHLYYTMMTFLSAHTNIELKTIQQE